MFVSEYSVGNNKSLKLNIRSILKNPEILKFVPDHLKVKSMCNYTVKKLPIVIRYASVQYKTVEMCDEAILENSGT